MRKFFTAAIVAATMLFATSSAQAQVKFGLKGGLNVTNMSLNSEVFDADNQTGFFIGPTVKFTLPIVGLGIDASALYDQRDAKILLRITAHRLRVRLRISLSTSQSTFAMVLDLAVQPVFTSLLVRSSAST